MECEILEDFKDGEVIRNGGKSIGCRWQPGGDICYYNGNAQCTAEGGWVCEYASSDETVGSCNCSETHTCEQGYCQSGNTCYYNLDCGDTGWIGSSESLDNKCENNIRHFDGVCTSSGVHFNKESCSFSKIFPAFHGYEVWNYTCTPEKCEKDLKLYASDLKTFVNGVEADYFFLSPASAYAGETVTAHVTGFEGYDGKTVYVGRGKEKVLICSCTISGGKCSCTFSAPKLTETESVVTYYARIDLNGDGDYDDEGEEWSSDLTVYCRGKGEACESGECCAGLSCYKGICQYVGGGCPVLKAWDGKEFKEIEKLNIHSEEGIDTVYSTQIKMEPYDKGIYKIILQEKWYALWEGSHIDSIKLTDSEGKECKLTEAIHSKRGDVLDELIESDDLRVETKPGESIELTFTNCEGNEFNLEIEGFNPWRPPLKLALNYTNIMIIGITVSLLVVIILMFKRFMVRK
ncbi:MAG: hypothetical protein DRN00_03495 [Thermoplasmata archaeon]|nr:MAG: hypothetical protein DRN00_03495 [Thermoplasmata archaeon]